MAKRNIMRAFKLDEISVVDMPAQEGAVVTLTKSAKSREDDPLFIVHKAVFGDMARNLKAGLDLAKATDDDDAIRMRAHGIKEQQGVSMGEALRQARKEIEAQNETAEANADAKYGKDTDMTKQDTLEITDEAVNGLAKAIQARHGCSPADARTSALMQIRDLGVAKSGVSFNDAVAAIEKRDGCSRNQAMQKARREHPEALASIGPQRSGTALEAVARGGLQAMTAPNVTKAKGDFMKTVTDIQARDRCSRNVAMQKARNEQPEAFAAWQSA